jgi:DNA-binding NarL/FixJ family response regulator
VRAVTSTGRQGQVRTAYLPGKRASLDPLDIAERERQVKIRTRRGDSLNGIALALETSSRTVARIRTRLRQRGEL